MKQYTVTFRTSQGFARFRVIDALDREGMRAQIMAEYPGATILTARENDPPLAAITEIPS